MLTLYKERTHCPYCGLPLPLLFSNKTISRELRPHIDHMHPVSRGGEDSIRNAVYVCGRCNYAKRDKLFLDWLATLTLEQRENARAIYIAKHSHNPEEFEPGKPQERVNGLGVELDWPAIARRSGGVRGFADVVAEHVADAAAIGLDESKNSLHLILTSLHQN